MDSWSVRVRVFFFACQTDSMPSDVGGRLWGKPNQTIHHRVFTFCFVTHSVRNRALLPAKKQQQLSLTSSYKHQLNVATMSRFLNFDFKFCCYFQWWFWRFFFLVYWRKWQLLSFIFDLLAQSSKRMSSAQTSQSMLKCCCFYVFIASFTASSFYRVFEMVQL